MAKNRKEEDDPSEETEVSSPGTDVSVTESESGSETEPEPEQPQKKPSGTTPKKPLPQQSSSSSSESGSESDGEIPNPFVKPISSIPFDEPKKFPAAKKPISIVKITSAVKPCTGAGAKRTADDSETKESKRSKRKPEKEVENPVKKPNEDVKKQLFQRIWSEGDEVVILKGMIDYRSKNKSDPVADLNAFHEFIKKLLHVDVSKTQLQDKIRRLKRKYTNNASKEKEGKGRIFLKYHEQKMYDLSKKIWGKDRVEVDRVVENETSTKERIKNESNESKEDEKKEKTVESSVCLDLVSCGRSLADIEKWLEVRSGLISEEKRNEMNEKLNSLKEVQMELCYKRTTLIQEQQKLVREAMKALQK